MSKNICKFCGESINKNDKFCNGCGAKIEKDEEIQDAIIEKDKTSKKDTNYLLVLILILIVAIVVFSGLLIIFKK